jgi:hypothetical protein
MEVLNHNKCEMLPVVPKFHHSKNPFLEKSVYAHFIVKEYFFVRNFPVFFHTPT